MSNIFRLVPGKPMRLMTPAEKVAEFQRRIDDVTVDEASTPHGKAYLARVRGQLARAITQKG